MLSLLPMSVVLTCQSTGLTAFAGWKEFAKVKKVSYVSLVTASVYRPHFDRATRFSYPPQPELWDRSLFPCVLYECFCSRLWRFFRLVVQLAKLESLKVIGSAGSDEKVKFLKELGVDVAFNYKTTDLRDVLKKEGPIDLYAAFTMFSCFYRTELTPRYWDNVGGDTLDAALENASTGARVIVSLIFNVSANAIRSTFLSSDLWINLFI